MAWFLEHDTVVDPVVPGDAARILRYALELIPYGTRSLPAAPGPVWPRLVSALGLQAAGMLLMALASYRLGAYDIAALHLQQIPYFLVILTLVGGLLSVVQGIAEVRRWRDKRSERLIAEAAIRYHRKYVVPYADMDADAASVWMRVVKAVNAISRSRASIGQWVDTAWVSNVLPHHQWDIADKLARLSWLRKRQRLILAGTDPRDASVAGVLRPQLRAQEIVTAEIERHVQLLEDFARQATAAQAAMVRERIAGDLAGLDEPHGELLAQVHHWYTEDLEEVSRDLRAAAEAALPAAEP